MALVNNLKYKNNNLNQIVFNVSLLIIPLLIGFGVVINQINLQFIKKRTNQSIERANGRIKRELDIKTAEQLEKQDQRLKRELAERQIFLIEPQRLVVANTQNLPVIEVVQTENLASSSNNNFSQQSSNISQIINIQNQVQNNTRGIIAN